MAKQTRTAQENSDWWHRQAERYDRQAAEAKTPHGRKKWEDRAVLARAAATKAFI